MMKTTLLLFTVIFAGCVSVRLDKPDSGKRAEGVVFDEPRAPFSKENNPEVDAAWKNAANGNVISFLSDCKDPSDPPLEQVVQGVVSGISDLKYESNESATAQGREAKRVVVSGKVDGVPSQIDLLVYKRNHCIFILSYVGVKSAFAANQAEFNRFINGFKAP